MTTEKNTGKIIWVDLTIPNAGEVRDFYANVVGWEPNGVDMGDYEDFNMMPPNSDTPQAGICHKRGPNADLPATWMIYIAVEDLAASLQNVEASGGKILVKPNTTEDSAYAIIQDPAGAVCALIGNG